MGQASRPLVRDAIDRRELEMMYRRDMVGQPAFLTEQQVLERTSVQSIDPQPKKARAWVRFGTVEVRVNVYVLAWTDRCVRIRFQLPDKSIVDGWVWAPAVDAEEWVRTDR